MAAAAAKAGRRRKGDAVFFSSADVLSPLSVFDGTITKQKELFFRSLHTLATLLLPPNQKKAGALQGFL